MVDRVNNIAVKVRLEKDGELNTFRDMSKELGDLEPAAEGAEKAVEKLSRSTERGFKGSYRATVDAKAALQEYREQVEAAQAAGGVVTEEQLDQLKQLEEQYGELVTRVGEYKSAQAEASKELKKATDEATGSTKAITSLGDAAEKLGPKWEAAAKTFGAVSLTMGAATAALDKLRDGLASVGIEVPNLSLPILSMGENIERAAEAMVGMGDASTETANQMKVLAANGIDVVGRSAEEVGKLYEEFTEKLREGKAVIGEVDEEYKKWRESLGPMAEELDKVAEALVKNIAKLEETEGKLSEAEFAARIQPQIDALLAQYAKLGEEPPESIQALIDKLGELEEATTTTTDEMASKWGTSKSEIEKAVEDLRSQFKAIPDDLAALAEANNITINAWERHNVAVTGLPSGYKSIGQSVEEAAGRMREGVDVIGDQEGAMGGASEAAHGFATAQDAAAQAAERLALGTGSAATSLADIKTGIDGVGSKFEAEFGNAEAVMERLRLKAEETRQAILGAAQALETGEGEPS